jgi:hypothetical protein
MQGMRDSKRKCLSCGITILQSVTQYMSIYHSHVSYCSFGLECSNETVSMKSVGLAYKKKRNSCASQQSRLGFSSFVRIQSDCVNHEGFVSRFRYSGHSGQCYQSRLHWVLYNKTTRYIKDYFIYNRVFFFVVVLFLFQYISLTLITPFSHLDTRWSA